MPKPKNIVIIGAGVSGLSAGFYCLKNGHHVTILERCATPGGVSTCWKRKGYTFEGGIHWLAGSTSRMQPFHRLWKETGALQENNPIIFRDPVFTYTDGTVSLHLWRDARKLRDELLAFAPEDGKAIRRLYRHQRFISHVIGTPLNLRHIMCMILALPHFLCFVTLLFFLSTEKYLRSFKNPHVHGMLSSILNPQQNAISLLFTLASYHLGDNGCPEGGSRKLSSNMAERVVSMGGEILYNTTADHVCIEDRHVTGVQTDKGFMAADEVIIAMDTKSAITKLLQQPLEERWARNLMNTQIESEQCMLISLGIKADLKRIPETLRIHLQKPMQIAGHTYSTLWLYNYSWRIGYCPEGCSSLSMLFMGDSYDYWKAAQQDGTYRQKKQEAIQLVIRQLEEHVPEVAGNVVVTDMATPLTYERYCNSHRGGYMGIWRAGTLPPTLPSSSSTVKGLHFAGMRMKLSGGLPIALVTGYNAAKSI